MIDISFALLLAAGAAQAPVAAQPNEMRAPVRHARLRSGAVTMEDYPVAARRARLGGTALIRFEVGPTGRVEQCIVTQSSGHSVLDSRACARVGTWRFRPARSAGRPTAEMWSVGFTWTPPEHIRLHPPEPLVP